MDPYNAYLEGKVFSANPVHLVIALYEGAIEAVGKARLCLAEGDIFGRGQHINKAIRLIAELLVSLDMEQGGELSAKLKQLYGYMQVRLLDAHAKQQDEALAEVISLLQDLLEGWQVVAENFESTARERETALPEKEWQKANETRDYGFSFDESPAFASRVCAVF